MAIINGTSGDNIITGTPSADIINGLSGNDTVDGGDGADLIDGGTGNDILTDGDVVGQPGDDDSLSGGNGTDRLTSNGGHDLMDGGIGNDFLINGYRGWNEGGQDRRINILSEMHGGANNDTLHGAGQLYGDDGDDRIEAKGASYADGGTGNDVITDVLEEYTQAHVYHEVYTWIPDENQPEDGDIDFGHYDVSIEYYYDGPPIYVAMEAHGGTGNDIITLGRGANIVYGDDGSDIIKGSAAYVSGGAGDDQIIDIYDEYSFTLSYVYVNHSDPHHDGGDMAVLEPQFDLPITYQATEAHGGMGNDTIALGYGDNKIFGDEGNDNLSGQGKVYGGIGDDTLNVYASTEDPYSVTPVQSEGFGDAGNDTLNGDAILHGGDDDDTVNAGSHNAYGDKGNDTVYGGSAYGGEGNDEVHGNFAYGDNGNDEIYGSTEAHGGTGDDHIIYSLRAYGEAGNDSIQILQNGTQSFGGDDNDTLYMDGSPATWGSGSVTFSRLSSDFADLAGFRKYDALFDGGNAIDTLVFGATNDAILTDTFGVNVNTSALHKIINIEIIDAGAGNDIVNLTTNQYAIGNMTVYGREGNDVIWANTGNDTLDGGANNDSILGMAGKDVVTGGDGNDTIYGGDGDDTLSGNNQDDSVFGDNGNDFVSGGEGNDSVTGGVGDDKVYGEGGDDTVRGGDGVDLVGGGTGNDDVRGGEGDDSVYGNDGNDRLEGDGGNDYLSGGNGDDLMRGELGDDTLYGNSGTDDARGGEGNDIIYGGSGNDYIAGDFGAADANSGNDRLYGELGNDAMHGGLGNDLLVGGSGADNLFGEGGADTFAFDAATIGFIDRIKDFSMAQGDRLDLSGVLTGFDPLSDAIGQFVKITTNGVISALYIDRNGTDGGIGFEKMAVLDAIHDLNVQTLYANGQIVV